MDNRWRFLYYDMTELWGHVQRAEAGNGIPVQARYQIRWKNRVSMGRRDAERNKVAKPTSSHWREKLLVNPKAPVPETDAGGRGENPETNGRTLVKELGKMTP